MSTTSPINGLPIPDEDSPNDPPIHFGGFSDILDDRLLPPFASATERDNAFALRVSAGHPMHDGMYAHLNDDGRLWRYKGSGWAWPRWAMGEIAYASRSSQLGPETGVNTAVPIPGLSASFTLPSARKVRLTLACQVMSDAAGGQTQVRINNTTSATVKTTTVGVAIANFGTGATVILRQSLAAGTYSVQAEIVRLNVAGNAFLTGDLAELIVEDMGAPS